MGYGVLGMGHWAWGSQCVGEAVRSWGFTPVLSSRQSRPRDWLPKWSICRRRAEECCIWRHGKNLLFPMPIAHCPLPIAQLPITNYQFPMPNAPFPMPYSSSPYGSRSCGSISLDKYIFDTSPLEPFIPLPEAIPSLPTVTKSICWR